MNNELDMLSNRIENLTTPINDTDATNKSYVTTVSNTKFVRSNSYFHIRQSRIINLFPLDFIWGLNFPTTIWMK